MRKVQLSTEPKSRGQRYSYPSRFYCTLIQNLERKEIRARTRKERG